MNNSLAYFALALSLSCGFYIGYRSRELRGHTVGSFFVLPFFIAYTVFVVLGIFFLGRGT